MIRPGKLDIVFNKSEPKQYEPYVQELDTFLQSRQSFSLSPYPPNYLERPMEVDSVR